MAGWLAIRRGKIPAAGRVAFQTRSGLMVPDVRLAVAEVTQKLTRLLLGRSVVPQQFALLMRASVEAQAVGSPLEEQKVAGMQVVESQALRAM